MRLVHDDVIKFMKKVAEQPTHENENDKNSPYYQEGLKDGATEAMRIVLQKMGVSYG